MLRVKICVIIKFPKLSIAFKFYLFVFCSDISIRKYVYKELPRSTLSLSCSFLSRSHRCDYSVLPCVHQQNNRERGYPLCEGEKVNYTWEHYTCVSWLLIKLCKKMKFSRWMILYIYESLLVIYCPIKHLIYLLIISEIIFYKIVK